MKKIIDEIVKTEHGFKHIIAAGEEILTDKKINHFGIAIGFLKDKRYQVRMLASYILGQLSPHDSRALKMLEDEVVKDENWRIQEMLAKALDHYCKMIGYKNSLPQIKKWLADKNENVNRAVIEGLRIWTGRPYFKDEPSEAIKLISLHKGDKSEYVRKSVGNALRDISRKHPELIKKEISKWNLADEKIQFTYRLVIKNEKTDSLKK